jgi:hypothetical protein
MQPKIRATGLQSQPQNLNLKKNADFVNTVLGHVTFQPKSAISNALKI